MPIKIMVLLLVAVMPLSSCQTTSPINPKFAAPDYTSTPAMDFPDVKVMLSREKLQSFERYIKNISTNYPYSEFFGIDEAYEANKIPAAGVFTHGLTNSPVTGDTLFDAVVKNNKRYLAGHPLGGGNSTKGIPDKKLKEYCGYIAQAYNAFCARYPDADAPEARCTLENLAIFRDDITVSLAYVTNKDNRLGIAGRVVKNNRQTQEEKNELRHILCHEVAHFFQNPCPHNKKDPYTCGVSKQWNHLSVNPYYWHFYFEASAEKAAADLLEEGFISYSQAIRRMESMSFATILNASADVEQQIIINMTKDEDLFYRQFNAQTDSEKKELVKMMMAADLIFIPEEHTDFFDAAGIDKKVFGPEGEAAVCETLTKHFYLSLAQSIVSSSDVTPDDVFYLITAWEADLHYYLTYSDEKLFEKNKAFMRKYIDMQQSFLSAVDVSGGMDMTEAFSQYKPGDGKNRLIWLPKDKREFVFEKSARANRNRPHIRDIYEQMHAN